MENTKLLFIGSDNEAELEVFYNTNNEIFIEIQMHDLPSSFIFFNKSTAIKLAKELRKQISYLEDEL